MGLFSWGRSRTDGAWLVVGLGNFPDKYKNTRHNAGFIALDELAQRYDLAFRKHKCHAAVAQTDIGSARVIAAKPLTYMNNSGEAVSALMKFYKIPPERLVVLYDDIDIPEGTLRIRSNGSAGTHNGMRSIISCIGSEQFPRVRIGVGAPPKGGDLIKFVMGNMTDDAREAAKRAALAAVDVIENGAQHAMGQYNGKAGKA